VDGHHLDQGSELIGAVRSRYHERAGGAGFDSGLPESEKGDYRDGWQASFDKLDAALG
jgi:hypothetical protein